MQDRERPPARGRPRDAARDAAIFEATLRVLTEVGYDRLTIESVAASAGVGKATVYRRYPGKAALVIAAVEQRGAAVPPAAPADDLREALLQTVQWLARQIAEQEIGMLGAVFAGMRSDPELAEGMRRIRQRDEAAMIGASLDGTIERGGPLAPGAADLFAEIAPAVIVHRIVVTGQPCDLRFLTHLVDDVLLPLLQNGKA